MKKIIFYITCFALGCLNGYLLSKEEPKTESPFDSRLIVLLSEYENTNGSSEVQGGRSGTDK